MRVIFLGVGEAFDENLSNSSSLILSNINLLLDCGYSIPRELWKYNSNPSFLDAIYISHLHADHYFGIPPLLVRMWEEKRASRLTIICQKDSKERIMELIERGYPRAFSKLNFDIDFIEVDKGETVQLHELTLSFAPTAHSIPNLAIKITDGKKTVCYSGDGMYNQETEKLYENADLVIHEAYLLDRGIIGHASIKDLIKMAKRNNIRCLVLIHLQRKFRMEDLIKTKSKLTSEKDVKVIIPEPLEEYIL